MMRTRQEEASSNGQYGFSLIEMLAGIAILAVLALLAMPAARKSISVQIIRSAAADVASVARMARSAAVRTGSEHTMRIDLATRRYWVDGFVASRQLPAQVGLELVVPPGEQARDAPGVFRFLPSGGSSGGQLVLRDGTRSAIVEVDWLTGGTRVVWTQ